MNALTDKWDAVEKFARDLGVTDEAMRKWRERNTIPPRWHLPLITVSKGKLRAPDFLPSREAAQ